MRRPHTSRLYSALGATEAADLALKELHTLVRSTGSIGELKARTAEFVEEVLAARPTSALLINTFRELLSELLRLSDSGVPLGEAKDKLASLIEHRLVKAREAVENLAEMGARRIVSGSVILTHSYSYSVIRTLEKAVERGARIKAYVTESRPGGEGLVTAEELYKRGIPVTLIVDSAARFVMNRVNMVFIGAESIAANGAVVNKVGTSQVALAAHEARVRVFVAAGTYKFSVETVFGELVEIPSVPPSSLLSPEELGRLGADYKVWAPLMDVTPPEYIDAIVTEKGIIAPEAVPVILRELYGSWPPQLPEIEELLEKLKGG